MNIFGSKHLCSVMVAVLAACFLSTNAAAALPTGTVLQFNAGSYFAVDIDNDGSFSDFEKTVITMHDGVILGTVQPATGSHFGPPDGSETPGIDQPWAFFGNTGMSQSTSPVNDNGDGTLDFRGWGITWNGIPNIPIGDPATDTRRASIVCPHNPCQIGDSYTLDYRGHVPAGDPSGFGGVFFAVHLEGIVVNGNAVPRISLTISGGQIQECSAHGGTPIAMSAVVTLPPGETLASLTWTIDGNPAGSGAQINPVVPVGAHTVRVEALTTTGLSAVATANVTVQDTVGPTVTAAFVDPLTGQAVSQVSKNAKAVVKAQAVDTCDAKPTVISVAGLPVTDGGQIKARVEQQQLVIDDATTLTLSVTATDASGNATIGQAKLTIVP